MSSTILALGGDDERAAWAPRSAGVDLKDDGVADAPAEVFGPDDAPGLSSAGRGGTNDIESQPGDTPAMPIARTRRARKPRVFPKARPLDGFNLWTRIVLKVSRIFVSNSTTNVGRPFGLAWALDVSYWSGGDFPKWDRRSNSAGTTSLASLGLMVREPVVQSRGRTERG
jgi:hypothetical protein